MKKAERGLGDESCRGGVEYEVLPRREPTPQPPSRGHSSILGPVAKAEDLRAEKPKIPKRYKGWGANTQLIPFKTFPQTGTLDEHRLLKQTQKASRHHLGGLRSLARGKRELGTCRGEGPGEGAKPVLSWSVAESYLASHHTGN